ncbi:forkhead associated domain-containing protein [Cyclospora cayetanensis]|uniref:E3 ubiquitin-protein ligase CHFR n=1 Tax=Cyclospora cayetanensis TaxID=88456 RepID=A0A1D3D9K1_9EIME|nr:forkhead associated domain-containing protein [Cyclospora cayetanensis]
MDGQWNEGPQAAQLPPEKCSPMLSAAFAAAAATLHSQQRERASTSPGPDVLPPPEAEASPAAAATTGAEEAAPPPASARRTRLTEGNSLQWQQARIFSSSGEEANSGSSMAASGPSAPPSVSAEVASGGIQETPSESELSPSGLEAAKVETRQTTPSAEGVPTAVMSPCRDSAAALLGGSHRRVAAPSPSSDSRGKEGPPFLNSSSNSNNSNFFAPEAAGLELSSAIARELTCPICLDLFKLPVTVMCGHSFCRYCIGHKKLSRKACPLCRQDIGCSFAVNTVLCNLLASFTARFQHQQQRGFSASPRSSSSLLPLPVHCAVDETWWAEHCVKARVAAPLALRLLLPDVAEESELLLDDLVACVLDAFDRKRLWTEQRWCFTLRDAETFSRMVGYDHNNKEATRERLHRWVESYVSALPSVCCRRELGEASASSLRFVVRIIGDRVHRIEGQQSLPWDLGRHQHSLLHVPHSSVSLSHLLFFREKRDSSLRIVDLGSTIGTMAKVCGVRALQSGDLIHIAVHECPYLLCQWNKARNQVEGSVLLPHPDAALFQQASVFSPHEEEEVFPDLQGEGENHWASRTPYTEEEQEMAFEGAGRWPPGLSCGVWRGREVESSAEDEAAAEGSLQIRNRSGNGAPETPQRMDCSLPTPTGVPTEDDSGGLQTPKQPSEADSEMLEPVDSFLRLKILANGRNEEREIWVDPRGVVLGRGPHGSTASLRKISVTTSNGYVSRQHCLVYYDGREPAQRRWMLKDMSTLGTFIRLKPMEPYPCSIQPRKMRRGNPRRKSLMHRWVPKTGAPTPKSAPPPEHLHINQQLPRLHTSFPVFLPWNRTVIQEAQHLPNAVSSVQDLMRRQIFRADMEPLRHPTAFDALGVSGQPEIMELDRPLSPNGAAESQTLTWPGIMPQEALNEHNAALPAAIEHLGAPGPEGPLDFSRMPLHAFTSVTVPLSGGPPNQPTPAAHVTSHDGVFRTWRHLHGRGRRPPRGNRALLATESGMNMMEHLVLPDNPVESPSGSSPIRECLYPARTQSTGTAGERNRASSGASPDARASHHGSGRFAGHVGSPVGVEQRAPAVVERPLVQREPSDLQWRQQAIRSLAHERYEGLGHRSLRSAHYMQQEGSSGSAALCAENPMAFMAFLEETTVSAREAGTQSLPPSQARP